VTRPAPLRPDDVSVAPPTDASGAPPAYRYDGCDAAALARLLDVPRVELRAELDSTMDVAHELAAAGAPAGTIVLADSQRAGRGRAGRAWSSPPGSGIWLTLLERPRDASALEVLSLRLGLRAAGVLDRFAGQTVGLKWPNDLYLGWKKLGGILAEARWREGRPEWVAAGIGVNVVAPADVPAATGLTTPTRRLDVLSELVPALRAAAAARGPLTDEEVRRFAARDVAAGRRCLQPAIGEVRGISAAGELLVASGSGIASFRGGSLLLAEDA
jgi:BirA family transcriptional regulator, biotin operon repressor / biotin---[acetyl-CoA-carboxylase] ligase